MLCLLTSGLAMPVRLAVLLLVANGSLPLHMGVEIEHMIVPVVLLAIATG